MSRVMDNVIPLQGVGAESDHCIQFALEYEYQLVWDKTRLDSCNLEAILMS